MSLEKVLLVLLSLGQGVWMLSWVIGRWTQEQETSNKELGRRLTVLESKPDSVLLDRDVRSAHARMDKAGHEMSDIASQLQGLEQRMRAEFMSRDMADQLVRESREDRKHIWDAIERLERGRNHRS